MPANTAARSAGRHCRSDQWRDYGLRRKIHIGIDDETPEVRVVDVTGTHIGDAPMLPDLPEQIPPDQMIGGVTADGAYDTRTCHGAVAARNAAAVIPPRKKRQTLKADEPRCRGTQRSSASFEVPRTCNLARVERLPQQEPRRKQDELH